MKHCATCTCSGTADPRDATTRRGLMERAIKEASAMQAIATYRRQHNDAFGYFPSLQEAKELYEQMKP